MINDPCQPIEIQEHQRERFKENGFIIQEELISPTFCELLCDRINLILNQEYSLNTPPDKFPPKPLSCTKISKQVIHLINIWKCDHLFSQLVRSRCLGRMVAELAGWAGARVAEDQLWVKPPGSNPLVFHRDSVYFDFEPQEVITVWFALDDMRDELGPLQYVRGSHLWSQGQALGAAKQFYSKNHHANLNSTAEANGIGSEELEFTRVMVKRGGVGVHNGMTWHGSDGNRSGEPRRGIGIHFVPHHTQFNPNIELANIWKKYKDPNSFELPIEHFPITYLREELQEQV